MMHCLTLIMIYLPILATSFLATKNIHRNWENLSDFVTSGGLGRESSPKVALHRLLGIYRKLWSDISWDASFSSPFPPPPRMQTTVASWEVESAPKTHLNESIQLVEMNGVHRVGHQRKPIGLILVNRGFFSSTKIPQVFFCFFFGPHYPNPLSDNPSP